MVSQQIPWTDVYREAYCYLPFLEEMKYVPKHKYSYGHEIRDYINFIADKYEVSKTAMFRTKINNLLWDEASSEWEVSMAKERKSGGALELNVTAQFVISTSGLLLYPKLLAVPGLENFKGTSFHTSRWNYKVTGSSQEDPALENLSGKRVGIIGTGATAIQAVPHLAKYAKHLTIFQRTPSSVDSRGQRQTDKSTCESDVASKPGWWRERNLNLAAHLSDVVESSEVNLVND